MYYQKLFNYMSDEHDVILLETDMQEICNIVNEMQANELRQPLVSGSLPCYHNFIQKDTYWQSCTHCGMIAPLGQ